VDQNVQARQNSDIFGMMYHIKSSVAKNTQAGSPGSLSFSKPNIMVANAFRVLFIHSNTSAMERFTATLGGDIIVSSVPLQLGCEPPLHKQCKFRRID
jgi:hypothetical protein